MKHPESATRNTAFSGANAQHWVARIGAGGDLVRTHIVKPVIASILQYKREPDTSLRTSWLCDQPLRRTFLREALVQSFRGECSALDIQGRHIFDIGCGEGFLGRWASGCGIFYTGVDPEPDLITYAKKNNIEQQYHEFAIDMIDSCAIDRPVDLITIISVLEYCGDLNRTLTVLRKNLTALGLDDTPVYVATLDPDFFKPKEFEGTGDQKIRGHYLDASIYSPIEIEKAFVSAGFHILEQAPTVISTMPKNLQKYLFEEYKELPLVANTRHELLLPSQGPFYHWLLLPGKYAVGGTIRYAPGERIALKANMLGSVSRVVSGSAAMKNDNLGIYFEFNKNRYFGQMELDESYYSSRLLADVTTRNGCLAEHIPYRDARAILEKSHDTTSRMFYDILYFFSTTRFDNYISGSRSASDDKTLIFPDFDTNRKMLSTVASCILKKYSSIERDLSSTDINIYPRPVRYSEKELLFDIYRDDKDRREPPARRALKCLRAYGVLDVYNISDYSHLFRALNGLQMSDLEDTYEEIIRKAPDLPMTLANVLASILDKNYSDIDIDSIKDLSGDLQFSAAVNLFFGQQECKSVFDFYAGRRPEANYLKTHGERRPLLGQAIAKQIASSWGLEQNDTSYVEEVLNAVRNVFTFHRSGSDLSSYIMLRDTWALFACIDDAVDLVASPGNSVPSYPDAKAHVENYLWYCICDIARGVKRRISTN